MAQLVNNNDQATIQATGISNLIDNYIYLYHLDQLIIIPTYPEELSDAINTNFSGSPAIASSAPVQSFSNAGPRTLTVQLDLHRDMLYDVNKTNLTYNAVGIDEEDYMDILIKGLQSAALPRYQDTAKMVDPPVVAVRFGNEVFCKGVLQGGVSVSYSGPILTNNKYAMAKVSFTVTETDPYDATAVLATGGFRGLSTDFVTHITKQTT